MLAPVLQGELNRSDLGGGRARRTRSRRGVTGWGTGSRPPEGSARTRAGPCGTAHSWPCSSGWRWEPTGWTWGESTIWGHHIILPHPPSSARWYNGRHLSGPADGSGTCAAPLPGPPGCRPPCERGRCWRCGVGRAWGAPRGPASSGTAPSGTGRPRPPLPRRRAAGGAAARRTEAEGGPGRGRGGGCCWGPLLSSRGPKRPHSEGSSSAGPRGQQISGTPQEDGTRVSLLRFPPRGQRQGRRGRRRGETTRESHTGTSGGGPDTADLLRPLLFLKSSAGPPTASEVAPDWRLCGTLCLLRPPRRAAYSSWAPQKTRPRAPRPPRWRRSCLRSSQMAFSCAPPAACASPDTSRCLFSGGPGHSGTSRSERPGRSPSWSTCSDGTASRSRNVRGRCSWTGRGWSSPTRRSTAGASSCRRGRARCCRARAGSRPSPCRWVGPGCTPGGSRTGSLEEERGLKHHQVDASHWNIGNEGSGQTLNYSTEAISIIQIIHSGSPNCCWGPCVRGRGTPWRGRHRTHTHTPHSHTVALYNRSAGSESVGREIWVLPLLSRGRRDEGRRSSAISSCAKSGRGHTLTVTSGSWSYSGRCVCVCFWSH